MRKAAAAAGFLVAGVLPSDAIRVCPGAISSARPCDYTGMSVADHPHPVDARSVAYARGAALSPDDAERLNRLLDLISDAVRSRVLFALVSVDELCVGDLALTLDVSMDQASYALRLLRSANLVQTRRDGRVVYYRLADAFPHQLLEHCLRQLLAIASGDPVS
jgi:ArsR family transcriptional regulator, lead/cadmium/zinc/bismuth-responsive transcriptional repressor